MPLPADVSRLRAFLPADIESLAGHVLVKYDACNPANSMVLTEEWSGLRTVNPRT